MDKKEILKGFGEEIKRLRKEKGMTQEELAIKCGYNGRSSINKIEKGKADIPQRKLKQIAEALGTTPGKIIEKGSNYHVSDIEVPQFHKLPVYGMVSAGLGDFAENRIVDYEEASEKYNKEKYFYLVVDGDSMEPKIHDGEYALCEKTNTVESGTIAIVNIDGEEGVIKKVIYDEESISLISFNQKYEPRVFKNEEKLRLRVQGRVIKTVSKW